MATLKPSISILTRNVLIVFLWIFSQILDVIFHEEVKNKAESPGWILQTSLSKDELSQLSPTSCLCLWFGILAQLDVSDLLLHNEDNKSLLLDIMLDRILDMGSKLVNQKLKYKGVDYVL